MRRVICAIMLLFLATPLVGCDSDSVNDNAPASPDDAKATASKMPLPETKAIKKK